MNELILSSPQLESFSKDCRYVYKSEDPNDRKIWVTEPGTGSQQ